MYSLLYKQGDRQLLHPRHKPKGCLSSARLQGSRSKWLSYEGGGMPLEICAVTWCLELQRPGNNALHHRRMPDTAATCPNAMPAFNLFQHAESPTASMAVLMMDGTSRFLCCGRAWQDIISCIHMLLRMSQCCALTHGHLAWKPSSASKDPRLELAEVIDTQTPLTWLRSEAETNGK